MQLPRSSQRNCPERPAVTLVELLVVVGVISILVSLLAPAVQQAREATRRMICSDKMRQIALASHNFEASWKRLPMGHEAIQGRRPLQTWIPKLLPFVEQNQLFYKIESAYQNSSNPFDRAIHADFNTVLSSFGCPSDSRISETQVARGVSVALTSYVGVNGTNYELKDGVLFLDSRIHFADITDGLSNTLCFIERPPSSDFYFGWWYAGFADASVGAQDSTVGTSELNHLSSSAVGAICSQGPFRMRRRALSDAQCGIFHPWSFHTVVHATHVDGSVNAVSYDIAPEVLQALGSRGGGEVQL